MEKLLKQIYYLHRKEIKELESRIELLSKDSETRVDQNCRKCAELKIALQKKTEECIKLRRTIDDGDRKKSYKNDCSFNEVSEDENHSISGIQKNNFKETKHLSIFDDVSPIHHSQKSNQINKNFSPVPETPIMLMKEFNFSSVVENSSTIISETIDESLNFSNSKSLKNLVHPLSINVAQVSSIDETNCVDSSDCIGNSLSPEVVLLSPVFSSQECSEDKLETSSSEMAIDELNASLDDFEIPKLFKKRRDTENSQKATKLKKSAAKITASKSSATLTNAKYSFIPAGKGYRKPKYKQTTLSQTFGDKSNIGQSNNLKPGCSLNKIKEMSQNDMECTFVPTQYLTREPINKRITDNLSYKEISSIKCPENDDSDSNSSEDLLASFLDTTKEKDDGIQEINQDSIKEIKSKKRDPFFDDYDVIPKSPTVNYKYMRDAVKKKDERNKLKGQQCLECEKYYNGLGLSESEKKQRLNECSRHRNNFARPKTPEHFWSPEFPTTQECKRRGILELTQDGNKRELGAKRLKK